jgi:hypothetical protein
LGSPKYYEAAAQGARFLLTQLWRDDQLLRIWAAGQASIPGFLDDYAALANACLDLYETDFHPAWLEAALRLAEKMDDLFLDAADGTYFYVAKDQEAALVRSKSVHDQSVPAGNSLTARVFWRLWRFTGKELYQQRYEAILHRFHNQATENPWGFSHYLTVAGLSLLPPLDLTLVAATRDSRTEALLAEINRRFLPERRLALKDPADPARVEGLIPAAKDYAAGAEGPLAYLCHHYACQPPTGDPQELATLLEGINPLSK